MWITSVILSVISGRNGLGAFDYGELGRTWA